jgi:hypothetical protein
MEFAREQSKAAQKQAAEATGGRGSASNKEVVEESLTQTIFEPTKTTAGFLRASGDVRKFVSVKPGAGLVGGIKRTLGKCREAPQEHAVDMNREMARRVFTMFDGEHALCRVLCCQQLQHCLWLPWLIRGRELRPHAALPCYVMG